MRSHHSYPVHWGDAQPDQLCVIHQLSVLWGNHCWPPLPPQEETQPGPTHQGTVEYHIFASGKKNGILFY